MSLFKTFFGIDEKDVKETCVLLPLIDQNITRILKIGRLKKGFFFSSSSCELMTFVHTRIGAAFLGDASLYLAEAGCRNLIMFGACGITSEKWGLGIGELVSPSRCLCMASFTDMLAGGEPNHKYFTPTGELFNKLTHSHGNIRPVTSAAVGSIKLEERYIDYFENNNIHAVDMECSALYASCQAMSVNSAALLLTTDIIKTRPFYIKRSLNETLKFKEGIKAASDIIWELAKTISRP